MTDMFRPRSIIAPPEQATIETVERILAAVATAQGGELRVPRHYLDRTAPDVTVFISIDPVTDDVIVRLR